MERDDQEDITPEEIEVEFIYQEISNEIEYLQQQIDSPLPDNSGPVYQYGHPPRIRDFGTKAERIIEQKVQQEKLKLLRIEKVDKALENSPEYIKARAYARIEERENRNKDPEMRNAERKDISDSQQYLYKLEHDNRSRGLSKDITLDQGIANEKEVEPEDFLSSYSYKATPYSDKIAEDYAQNSREVLEPDYEP